MPCCRRVFNPMLLLGQVWQPLGAKAAKELSWPIIIQSNFCSWNYKGPKQCNRIIITYELSEVVLRNTNQPKMSLKMSYKIVRVFVLLYCPDLFFEFLLGLPKPLMSNKLSHLYQIVSLNQRAIGN